MFGFLNIYKPKGKTSHDIVAILRKITKIKQIGHTGTLDPFAEGVLPICIGKSTKLIEYLKDDKAYIGTIKLGEATTTYDTEGEIVKTSSIRPTSEQIKNTVSLFIGNIEQIPPIYSAIKIQGKKLYEYARAGEQIELTPRKICIYKLEILSFDENTNELELYIECSKGTYIRSLANDIGEKLGTYGYLNRLVRVKAGDFNIDNAVKLEELQSVEDVAKNLLSPTEYINCQSYSVNSSEYALISNGNKITAKISDGTTLLVKESDIIAIGVAENGIIKPQKVFI